MKNIGLTFGLMLAVVTGFAQQKEYHEKWRPQFHFSPKAHWMNDPNGMVYYGGTFHLFFQYYPDSMVWGPMHWGHAVSKDMVFWQEQPIALFPDKLGYIFSGSAVVDKNNRSGFGAGCGGAPRRDLHAARPELAPARTGMIFRPRVSHIVLIVVRPG